MRRIAGLILLLAISLTYVASGQEPCPKDLEGTWDDVTPYRDRERIGYAVPTPRIPLSFEGSACTWGEPGEKPVRQSLYVPMRAGELRGMDFATVTGGSFRISRALYKVEADTLTIKEAAIDAPRPSDFAPWELPLDGRKSEPPAMIRIYKKRRAPE